MSTRESLMHTLDAELTRQLGRLGNWRYMGPINIDDLDLGAMADAIIADLPPAIPAAQLVERLSAIADKMEGAMMVEVDSIDQLIIESDHTLSDEQLTRLRETLAQARPFKGAMLDGGLRVRGKVAKPSADTTEPRA